MPHVFPYPPDDPTGDYVVTLPGDASIGEVLLYARSIPPVLGDYATEVLADSPWAFWMLDEPSGTTFVDLSGNGRHLVGVASGVAGETPGFAGFDPVADFPGGATDSTAEDGTEDFSTWTAWTLECWLQTGTSQNLGNLITTCSYSPDRNFELRLTNAGGSPPNRIQAVHMSSSGFVTAEADVDLVDLSMDPVPIHAVATWDGSDLKVYVDGSLEDTTAVSTATFDSQEVRVAKAGGGAGAGNRNYTGLLAGAVVYDYALDATRIAVHYTAGLT